MSVNLNFRTIGEGRPVIILHGLFGSASNWLRIAKNLSDNCQSFLPDLRNHGNSPHSPDMSYEDMADDLVKFIDSNGISEPLIIGHSMGGKVAMYLALTAPDYVSKLIVVDIAPVRYHNRHQSIIDAMVSVPFDNVSKRSDADDWDPDTQRSPLRDPPATGRNRHRSHHTPIAPQAHCHSRRVHRTHCKQRMEKYRSPVQTDAGRRRPARAAHAHPSLPHCAVQSSPPAT